MSQYILPVILLAGVFIFWRFRINPGAAGGPRISPSEAKKRLETEKGIILLDVRNRDEYIRQHIPNSRLIPLNILADAANQKLPDKNAGIFVYCASGSRSSVAVRTLVRLGYTRVYDLGGIARWPYETVAGKK